MKDTSELYAYRIIKTGEEDKTDYTVETFYNYWLHDFRDGVYRMCNNLGRHGNTPIQNIAYKEIKKAQRKNRVRSAGACECCRKDHKAFA